MYNSYFGFSVSPFSVTPDPNFFYSNPVYEEAYAILQYGITAKKGFIVITGEVGTGKTTLLRKLMTENLKGNIQTVFVFNTYLNFPELLEVIHDDLGLRSTKSNKVHLLQKLNEYLITQLKQSNSVAVLVDEAQNLSDEALEGLRLLSNLETDQEKLIQIVLMGQPELQRKLDRPNLRQLKQRVALQTRLLPLNDEEVGRYIDFRIRAAGYGAVMNATRIIAGNLNTGSNLFHPDAIRQITSYSNGIPRSVNIICDNALLSAYGRGETVVSPEIVNEVARDLSLGSECQVNEPEITPVTPITNPQPEALIYEGAKEIPSQKLSTVDRVGIKSLAAIFGFVAVASLFDPRTFLTTAQRGFETAKGNLQQWALLPNHQETVPTQANAEVKKAEDKIEPKHQRVTVPYGGSVYKIASDTYGNNTALGKFGNNTALGLDLIKEFNADIKSLGTVSAGQILVVPALTQETLLRKQSDGSYHLVAATFFRSAAADEYDRRLKSQGYQTMIMPTKVSEDLLLYRVTIKGLKNLAEANQTWATGLRNEWLAFAVNTDGKR